MAIIGGAGNPVGGSFTGPAQALEYIGDHCYAYSGVVACTSSGTDLFNFTSTTSSYIVGEIQINAVAEDASNFDYALFMNGSEVAGWLNTGSQQPHQPQNPVKIIIPPGTTVRFEAKSAASSVNHAATFVGRVYRD